MDREIYNQIIDAIAVSQAFQTRLKAAVQQAFENPRSFYDEDGEYTLAQRGLTFAHHSHLTPKFVLIDTLIEANQMTEIDWKEDEKEVRFCVLEMLKAKQLTLDFAIEEKYENEDTFEAINLINNRELKPNGYCLEILDIDSDSYVFTVVPLEKQQQVAVLFAKLK